jgi:hypothetical protein
MMIEFSPKNLTRRVMSLLQTLQLHSTLAFFTVLLAIFVIHGHPVPSGNEYVYLLRLKTTWDSQFLAGDWSFSLGASEHFLFNHTIGLLTLFLPLEIVGWVGRVTCWSAIVFLLFGLGRHFGLGPWGVATAMLAWLGAGQSLLADEWMIGGFEAKCVAYVLLMTAVVLLLEQRKALSAILLGLSFSFHPAVGGWGGLAVVLSLIAVEASLRGVIKYAFFAACSAMPGFIALLRAVINGSPTTTGDWAIAALVRMPHHLDPFSWHPRNYFVTFCIVPESVILQVSI